MTDKNLDFVNDQSIDDILSHARKVDDGRHVDRVGVISAFLAGKCGYPDEELEAIQLAASMHDIGKMAIDDAILNKPVKLTVEEFEHIKQHAVYGYEMLLKSEIELLKSTAVIAYEHHENYDGSGYPRGLSGETINIMGRIVALADVYDALAGKCLYRNLWPQDEILEYIRKERGKKFDPALVDIFFEHKNTIYDLVKDMYD